MKLEIGYSDPIEVRDYTYASDRLAGKRILYLSDLHYHRWSRQRVDRHIELIREIDPDLLLLGGDYVDTPFGLSCFQGLLESIGGRPTFAIAGNHDRPYVRRIRQMVTAAGINWLHHDSTMVRLGSSCVRIDGTCPAVHPAAEAGAGATGNGEIPSFSILCLHHPIDIRPFAHRYNLVFAGHLHGGQIVLWQTPKGLYPLRWRYRWNQLDLEYGQCRYLISRGIGDMIPVRYNCRRDVIAVTIAAKPDKL